MKLGDKIKRLREIHNIPTKVMADELGISLSGYMKIEGNIVNLTMDKLEKLAALFQMKTTEILTFDEKYIMYDTGKDKDRLTLKELAEMKDFYKERAQYWEEKYKALEERFKEAGEGK